jgi:hypothetical protein
MFPAGKIPGGCHAASGRWPDQFPRGLNFEQQIPDGIFDPFELLKGGGDAAAFVVAVCLRCWSVLLHAAIQKIRAALQAMPSPEKRKGGPQTH